jgi:hypothetical protein
MRGPFCSSFRLRPSALLRVACGFAVSSALCASAHGSETVQRSVTINVEVSSRTSLEVAAEALEFDVLDPAQPATSSIDFVAAARTRCDGEVLLIVEPLATPELTVASGGDAQNASNSAVSPTERIIGAVDVSTPGPKIASRWTGSGVRRGTVRFVLRATRAGRYRVPLRLVLSTP